MPFDRTLMLGGVAPGAGNVGEIFLSGMIGFLPAEQLVGTVFVPTAELDTTRARSSSFPLQVLPRRFEYAYRPFRGFAGLAAAWAARWVTYERYLRRLIRECVTWGRQQRVQQLWAILDTPTVIETVGRIADQLKVPVFPLVWDAPEHLVRLRGMDSVSKRRLMRRFADVLKRAQRTAVICEVMKERYEAAYGRPCVIVRYGSPAESRQPAGLDYTSEREFSICLAGTLYCHSAWDALLAALRQTSWQIAGKSVRLVVLGAELHLRERVPTHIEYLGFQRTVSDAIRIMSRCDLSYMPQPFESALRPVAELSFPTKLSTYVAAGRPVLVHCPDYGSLVHFVRQHPLGPICNSLDPATIAATIDHLATDRNAYVQAAKNVALAGAHEFSEENYRRQVEAFFVKTDRYEMLRSQRGPDS